MYDVVGMEKTCLDHERRTASHLLDIPMGGNVWLPIETQVGLMYV